MHQCNLERMKEKIKTFSRYGDAGHGGITRYALSAEDKMARSEFVRRMETIGAKIEIDDVANIYATIPGTDPKAKRIVIGSHCDSVKNGGNYDGILGVVSAMEVLETITEQKISHKHPITAMIWTNEEGSLYPPAMMVSGIVCNDYLPPELAKNFKYEDMMASKAIEEQRGKARTFGDALEESGYQGDKANRLNPDKYLCNFETHIEQGPILEENGKDVGVVDCVLGMFNYSLKFKGFAAHAGTFPMNRRHDALYAAAQALCHLHDEIDKLGRSELVYTTGEIHCHPCVHTVIPDEVELSLDVRHTDPEVLGQVMDIVEGIAAKKWAGCDCAIRENWKRDTVTWDQRLVGYVQAAADEAGISNMPIHSGAGHDAQFAAYMLPTTMIFIQTKDGLSHCEMEYAKPEHCVNGATVLLNAILKADADFE